MAVSKSKFCLALGTLASVLTPPSIATTCDRSALVEATRRYVAAQSLGEIKYLNALSQNTTYVENHTATNITVGIVSTPLKIDHSRSIYDTISCSTYTELIVTNPAHPYVIGTQMRFTADATHIDRLESIVADAGDWLFNAQHTLHYALQEAWGPIPEDSRDTREAIQGAADAYLDLFRNGNGSVEVPWADGCKRLEGGLYTAPGDTCSSGVPSGVELIDRQYVIDEAMGSIDVLLAFGGSKLPDSHQFRVEGGKIRFIHTITACLEPNCGFGDPPEELSEDVGF